MGRNTIVTVLLMALACAGGIYAMQWYYGIGKVKETKSADLILQQITTVSKLVTVEGHFSEVYRHEDYWGSSYWSAFKKKALLRVKARVLAGYDLSKMKVAADEATKTIRVTEVGQPQILAIDHNLDYYDMSEGMFNAFKPEDYTRLSEEAKAFVKANAEKSGLLESAKAQSNVAFSSIFLLAQSLGWTVEIEGVTAPVAAPAPVQQ